MPTFHSVDSSVLDPATGAGGGNSLPAREATFVAVSSGLDTVDSSECGSQQPPSNLVSDLHDNLKAMEQAQSVLDPVASAATGALVSSSGPDPAASAATGAFWRSPDGHFVNADGVRVDACGRPIRSRGANLLRVARQLADAVFLGPHAAPVVWHMLRSQRFVRQVLTRPP